MMHVLLKWGIHNSRTERNLKNFGVEFLANTYPGKVMSIRLTLLLAK